MKLPQVFLGKLNSGSVSESLIKKKPLAKKKPIYLPRVLSDKQAPKMRLNMNEEKRVRLIRTMLPCLINNEVLKTTAAKAKFLKFYAERIIDLAKEDSPDSDKQISKLLTETLTLSKLKGPLLSRFKETESDFISVILSGHRDYKKPTQGPTQYPDAALMAIIQINNSPKNISYKLVKLKLPILEKERDELKSLIKVAKSAKEEYLLNKKLDSLEKQIRKAIENCEKVEKSWGFEKAYLVKNLDKYQKRLIKKSMTVEQLGYLGYTIDNDVLSVSEVDFGVKVNKIEQGIVELDNVESFETEESKETNEELLDVPSDKKSWTEKLFSGFGVKKEEK